MKAHVRTVTTSIDEERCIGCGECVKVCPHDTISILGDKAVITGDQSLICDHCKAACEYGAITVCGIDRTLSRFTSFEVTNRWMPPGNFNTPALVNLMQSRRSCRHYLDEPVAKELLEDLVKIGITAPSGSNCQLWSFTILPDRESVQAFGNRLKLFFEKLNRLAEKTWLRSLLSLFGKGELNWYHENYYDRVREGLLKWDEQGIDLLFHGAPAVIVVSSRNTASCPAEDALLATQNILLAAHSLGLGTCLVGFAISAMTRDKSIRRFIELPEDEDPYAVIALGYPDESFAYVTGRKPVTVRYLHRTP